MSRASEASMRKLVVSFSVGIALAALPFFATWLGGTSDLLENLRWLFSLSAIPGIFVCLILYNGRGDDINNWMIFAVNAFVYFGLMYLVLRARRHPELS